MKKQSLGVLSLDLTGYTFDYSDDELEITGIDEAVKQILEYAKTDTSKIVHAIIRFENVDGPIHLVASGVLNATSAIFITFTMYSHDGANIITVIDLGINKETGYAFGYCVYVQGQ